MSATECCVGTSDGLSYSVFGSEVCQPCIGKFKQNLEI